MQLNKVLKGLMLVLPIMAIAACSSKKATNDQNGEGMLGAGTGMNGNGNMSSEEQARLQMQQLQQNNIVYFDLDKYDIRSDFAAMLDAHANFLRSNPSYKVTVEGHADIVSYGKEKPAVLGHDEAAYAKNRRAVLVY